MLSRRLFLLPLSFAAFGHLRLATRRFVCLCVLACARARVRARVRGRAATEEGPVPCARARAPQQLMKKRRRRATEEEPAPCVRAHRSN